MQRKYLIALGVAVALGIVAGKAYRSSREPVVADVVAPAGKITWELPTAIDEAAGYLVRVNDDSGRFLYRMSGDGKHVAPKKYNIVRHAGAIYALADYQVQGASAEGRAKAAAATARAADLLMTRYVRPLKADDKLLGVWSDPKEEGGSKFAVKLGGAGLSIIGLMGRYRAVDGGAPDSAKELETAQGLARFVQFMQKPNGEYTSKYTDEDGKVGDFESLYYPGEATLGLTMLYEADRDVKWLDTAMRGVGQLVISRRSVAKAKLPADHWLMIAIDRLLPFYDLVKEPSISKDEMIDHAVMLGKIMMEGQTRVSSQRPEIDGCFTRDGRTTPSATRLEGLLALEHALTGDDKRADVRKEVRASIVKGVAFLRRSQITTGPARGGIPAALVPGGEDGGADETESEEEKSGEIRIDFVQHAMSAMMRYVIMCKVDPTGCP